MEDRILRGKVTAYPDEENKGLVEVAVGAYEEQADKVFARMEHSLPGVYWLPEIGDAVEVALPPLPGAEARVVCVRRAEGDGQVEECWTEKNDKKQFKTRSGHTVTLDDTQDAASVSVATAGGLTLRLDDGAKTVTLKSADSDTPALTLDMENDKLTLSAGKDLSLTCGGAEVSIDSSGNIKISTGGDLSVSAKKISLEATANFTAKGQQAELNGSMTAAVSGQSQLDLTSSGITQVKGSMVKLN